MSRVFAVQIPAHKVDGEWVEKLDLSDARRFGELVRVLPYGNVPSDPRSTRYAIEDVMYDFSPADDYVLLLGDPVAIAAVAHFLCRSASGASFRALKWDKRAGRYEPYIVG